MIVTLDKSPYDYARQNIDLSKRQKSNWVVGMKHKVTLAVISLGILAGCAKAPEAVAPQYVSPMQYRNYQCDQLAEEIARNETAIAEASQQQRRARNNDIVGVIFIGLPVSSLSGDNVADYLGRLKGERDALAQVANEQRCGMSIRSADEIVEEVEFEPSEESQVFPEE